MCTAITFKTKDHYFGRNLDLEYHYNESVTITPRNFPLKFTQLPEQKNHHAVIGVATVEDDYPLYYDATNEYGLSAAGLHFPQNACYNEPKNDVYNIATFEFIPWLLGSFKTVAEALPVLEKINFTNTAFNTNFPPSPLHWLIADKNQAITLEALPCGVKIYDNPIGVLTNNPTFDIQLFNLNNYMGLSAYDPENRFAEGASFNLYSRGMGGLGLPGDLSSMSRFVRAAFTKLNSVSSPEENDSVGQFFHILSSVAHTRGTVKVEGQDEITVYSSCCNTNKGIYYYTTYNNRAISAVDMHKENLDGDSLVSYPLIQEENIFWQNRKSGL